VYFAATGVWPLIDMRSFERVTGPKVDRWLVRTVGALVAAIGGTRIAAAIRREVTPSTVGLAFSSAVGLGLTDVIYAKTGSESTWPAEQQLSRGLAFSGSYTVSKASDFSGCRLHRRREPMIFPNCIARRIPIAIECAAVPARRCRCDVRKPGTEPSLPQRSIHMDTYRRRSSCTNESDEDGSGTPCMAYVQWVRLSSYPTHRSRHPRHKPRRHLRMS
jgi:hypothetical protein